MKTPPWYENDAFWRAVEAALFSEEKWAMAKSDVDGMVKLLSLPSGSKILDLCCGPGRHAIELARRGYKVTGVDRTHDYLKRAQKIAQENRLKVEFVKDDMRRFVRPRAFDAAINLYTSFGYFEKEEETRQVLKNIYHSLKRGGSALFEMMSKEILARDFEERTWSEFGNLLLLQHRSVDKDWQWLESRWILIRKGKRQDFAWRLRLYSGSEFKALLRSEGFQKIRLYGSLDGIPYDQDARRLVAVAHR